MSDKRVEDIREKYHHLNAVSPGSYEEIFYLLSTLSALEAEVQELKAGSKCLHEQSESIEAEVERLRSKLEDLQWYELEVDKLKAEVGRLKNLLDEVGGWEGIAPPAEAKLLNEHRKREEELEKKIEQLNTILYSTDTPEWKSAAFQKIKSLESSLKIAISGLERLQACSNFVRCEECSNGVHNTLQKIKGAG